MMQRNLNDEERNLLDRFVAEAERRTGAQIVLAVVERSDVYAELPWKAFALGAAGAGLLVAALDLLRPGWHSSALVLLSVTATLLAGAVCALACIALPGVARLFLDAHRAQVETRQYAESLFLSREIFATRGRTGILLFASLFERQVVLIPDTGLSGRLGREASQRIIARMTTLLASGQVANALQAGLAGLEDALGPAAPAAAAGNELSNRIVEEQGP
jgi:putative membrane protein